MDSPSTQMRASLLRTLWLVLIGFLIIETVLEVYEVFKDKNHTPTHNAGSMFNRSQMRLAKEVLLHPTLFSCRPNRSRSASSPMYPIYIIIKSRAVSSGEYFQRRTFTRASWGFEAQSLGIPVIYAVSRAEDVHVQKLLENEHGNYGDILQFNYTDAQSNSFIKSASILNWFVHHNCQHRTPYLLIVDDTVLINLSSLLKMISTNAFDSNTIYGLNSSNPSMMTTTSILYPSRIVERIVRRKKSSFFSTDILITDTIAKRLDIHRAALPGAEDCSCTDLFSRVMISECVGLRRVYVWSKSITLRDGQNTNEINQLITKTTFNKYVRNDKSIFLISIGYHRSLLSIVVFILVLMFLSVYICQLISPSQPNQQTSLQLSIPVK